MAVKQTVTNIYSIFGQVDSVIAQAMVDEGKARKIPQDYIPLSALYDARGRKVLFAISMGDEYLPEYIERVRRLSA